jgi:hypothetical protein
MLASTSNGSASHTRGVAGGDDSVMMEVLVLMMPMTQQPHLLLFQEHWLSCCL